MRYMQQTKWVSFVYLFCMNLQNKQRQKTLTLVYEYTMYSPGPIQRSAIFTYWISIVPVSCHRQKHTRRRENYLCCEASNKRFYGPAIDHFCAVCFCIRPDHPASRCKPRYSRSFSIPAYSNDYCCLHKWGLEWVKKVGNENPEGVVRNTSADFGTFRFWCVWKEWLFYTSP